MERAVSKPGQASLDYKGPLPKRRSVLPFRVTWLIGLSVVLLIFRLAVVAWHSATML